MKRNDWPPLITDAGRPPVMLWRDRVLTIAVWILFLVLFIQQWLIFQARTELHFSTQEAEWDFLMAPFIAVVGIMVAWLIFTAVLTYRRALQARRQSQPPPLPLQAEAAHFRITPAELTAAREKQIIAVAIEDRRRLRFEAPTYTAPAAGTNPPAPPFPDRSVPGR